MLEDEIREHARRVVEQWPPIPPDLCEDVVDILNNPAPLPDVPYLEQPAKE